jgi:DNA-nicking Smr family endonuclease
MTSASGKKRSLLSPEERELFIAAVGDAKPLPASTRDRVPSPAPVAAKPPRPLGRAEVLPPEVRLTVDSSGERLSARGPGVSLEQVAHLRAGKVHVEDTLDLHRLSREDGIARLREFLLRARRVGRRCVLVVHGRGLHGDGHSPMREAVHAELLGSFSGLVNALTIASQRDGGEGATYVILRGAK